MPPHETPNRVVSVYLTSTVLTTAAASLIWGVSTLYMMAAGLNIFQVTLTNMVFALTQVVFEVPTGVVADTIGRRASYLISIALIIVSTLLYLVAGEMHMGFAGFAFASGLLAVAWTFQSGAVDAWLVDALDHTGFEGPKDRVFSRGGVYGQVAMLGGTLAGGLLGQLNLAWPFYVRAVLLGANLIFAAFAMRDWGFDRRELKVSTVLPEMRRILNSGVRYGWNNKVVRPLMIENLIAGVFFFYGFYSLQPYLIGLIGKQLVWVAAAVTAAGSLAGIAGSWIAPRLMDGGGTRRREGRVMLAVSGLTIAGTFGAGLAGVLSPAARGIAPVVLLTVMWLVISLGNGILDPVRRTFINEHIPSRERATVLSLDAMFVEAGEAAGNPLLGWISQIVSIPAAWLVASLLMIPGLPLFLAADKAAE